MKSFLALCSVLLTSMFCACGPISSGREPTAQLPLAMDFCGAPDTQEKEEEIILASHSHICNDCWRMHGNAPNAECGAAVVAAGSCASDPKIAYYKWYDTRQSTNSPALSYWYDKNGNILAAEADSCSSGGIPCQDFQIQIVWCW